MAQPVKNLSAIRKTQVQSLGPDDPLEKRMATHSNILAWRILWTEDLGELQSMESQRVSVPRLKISCLPVTNKRKNEKQQRGKERERKERKDLKITFKNYTGIFASYNTKHNVLLKRQELFFQ